MGGMLRWAIEEAVRRNDLKVYGTEDKQEKE